VCVSARTELEYGATVEVRFSFPKPPCGEPRRFLTAGGSLNGLSVECGGNEGELQPYFQDVQ
jgi:hypothetical protein